MTSSERVDDEVCLDRSTVRRPGPGDAHPAVPRRARTEEAGDPRSALDPHVRLGLGGGAQRALEHRPPDADGDERLVARPRLTGSELELPVLERPWPDDAVQHVGSLVQQRPPAEP